MSTVTELYEWPPTRSQRAKWALEELEISYSSHLVDLPGGEQDAGAYRALHPLGSVPALKAEGYAMFESVAIVLQLIDEHPEMGLAPEVGTPERAGYYQWCVFGCAELDPAIMTYFDHALRQADHMRPAGRRQDADYAGFGREDFAIRAAMLSKALSGRDYLVGDRFTGADLVIGHSCFMATVTGLIDGYPVLEAYFDRLRRRPGHRRAYPDAMSFPPRTVPSEPIGESAR